MCSNFQKTLRACYLGYVTQAIVVNLAPLFFVIFQTDYRISYGQIGGIVLFTFAVQMCVDLSMLKILPALGYRTIAIIAHVCSVIGLVLLSFLPRIMDPFAGILIAVFFYSIGGGLIEVVISPIVDSLPGDAKASSMSLLHSFYSWGQMVVVLLSAVLLKLIGGDFWYFIPLFWALLPLVNAFRFITVPLLPIPGEQRSQSPLRFLRSPIFIVAFLLMICSGAAEQAMAQWASLFAEQGLGVSKVVGDLLGPCLFALFMSIGRTFYGIKGEKINLFRALFACSCLAIICYLITVFCAVPMIALFGCALCGLGVSLLWPGMLSYTSEKYNYKAGPVMFGLLALGGDIGCSVGPWLIGGVSDCYIAMNAGSASTDALTNHAIKSGLLVATLFPVLIVILLLVMRRMRASQERKD